MRVPVATPRGLSLLVILLVALFDGRGAAESPFYAGKTITLLQGSEPRSSSDALTRVVIPFLQRHIPGHPNIVSDYMPGDDGVKAANYLFRGVKADGLTIGCADGEFVTDAILGELGVHYDPDKFIYLGSPQSVYHWLLVVRKETGVKVRQDLHWVSGLKIGAQAVGNPGYFVGRLFAYLIGLKDPQFPVGYAANDLDGALARGQIDARIVDASTLLTSRAEALKSGALRAQVIMDVPKGTRHDNFALVPKIDSYAESARGKKLLAMARIFQKIGTPCFLPPGTPEKPVNILKAAILGTFTDPGFLEEFKKSTGDEATPLFPGEMAMALRDLPRDRDTLALFKQLNGAGPLPQR